MLFQANCTCSDATLEQQVLDIPERERKPDLRQNHQPDHLGEELTRLKAIRLATWHRAPYPNRPDFQSSPVSLPTPLKRRPAKIATDALANKPHASLGR
ncbi:MAG: hypothetical protein J7496_01985 [Novosphingobium sp.]|nr:hypothetical protein [Novosphingobium sp.]